jgi:DNA-directed RNA polymerase specialized sigma24 family protein
VAAPGLNHESFESLLRALGPDRERAGERYEVMRERLVRFFSWRGARDAEDLADETFDRVGRRLREGEQVRMPDLAPYLLGVARNVLREAWERDRRRGAVQESARRVWVAAQAAPRDEPPALECLLRCLRSFPQQTRQLVLLYYEEEGSRQVEHRRGLAEGLGLGPNALRIRMHRLRARLEECVRACLQRAPETSRDQAPQRGERSSA